MLQKCFVDISHRLFIQRGCFSASSSFLGDWKKLLNVCHYNSEHLRFTAVWGDLKKICSESHFWFENHIDEYLSNESEESQELKKCQTAAEIIRWEKMLWSAWTQHSIETQQPDKQSPDYFPNTLAGTASLLTHKSQQHSVYATCKIKICCRVKSNIFLALR